MTMKRETNEAGETVITFHLGTNPDGTPHQVVVTLPKGTVLDVVTANEIVEACMRVARRGGSA